MVRKMSFPRGLGSDYCCLVALVSVVCVRLFELSVFWVVHLVFPYMHEVSTWFAVTPNATEAPAAYSSTLLTRSLLPLLPAQLEWVR